MEKKVLTTLEEIKAYSDPYRLQIFQTFLKLDRPATVKEVADARKEVPAKVYYHVKKLEKIGLLKQVATKEINGIVAKYYEPFSGEIEIKSKEADGPVRQLILNETQKLLNEMFEDNKRRFLKFSRSGAKPHGQLMNKALYMTREEAAQLLVRFQELCAPFEKTADNRPNERPDAEKYEWFTTLAKVVEEDDAE